jgi:hypothetical protein
MQSFNKISVKVELVKSVKLEELSDKVHVLKSY